MDRWTPRQVAPPVPLPLPLPCSGCRLRRSRSRGAAKRGMRTSVRIPADGYAERSEARPRQGEPCLRQRRRVSHCPIAKAIGDDDRHRPEPAPAGVRNTGDEVPVAARAARRPPSPRSAATSASCAASAEARVAASKEEATRQVCAANAQPLAAEWCRQKRPRDSVATARAPARPARIPARVAGGTASANTIGLSSDHHAISEGYGNTWSQRATASRWCPAHCAEVAGQLPLPCALPQHPAATKFTRKSPIGMGSVFGRVRWMELCAPIPRWAKSPVGRWVDLSGRSEQRVLVTDYGSKPRQNHGVQMGATGLTFGESFSTYQT